MSDNTVILPAINSQEQGIKNKLKEQRKKEYQKQREDLMKQLHEAYVVVKKLIERIEEISDQEDSDSKILDSLMSSLKQ